MEMTIANEFKHFYKNRDEIEAKASTFYSEMKTGIENLNEACLIGIAE